MFRIGVAENTDSRYRRQSHHIRLLLFLLSAVIAIYGDGLDQVIWMIEIDKL